VRRLRRHIGFLRELDEARFKRWLDRNAQEFLAEVGVDTGKTVLDFGCGTGTYTIPAARLVGDEGKVYALDMRKKALDEMEDKARKDGLKNIVRLETSGGVKIPLGSKTVDLILLIDVLHEIDDREGLFEEAYRVLKPGGALIVYPMHLAREMRRIEKLAAARGFRLEDRKFQGRILLFRKPKDV